jgi:hypothetical protein
VHEVDGRMMLGFLPYRRRTSRVKHLEIIGDTPLGQFADEQFEEQWRTARPLEGMSYADLQGAAKADRLLLRVWSVGEARYLASNRIEGILAADPALQGADDSAAEPALLLIVEDAQEEPEPVTLSEPIGPHSAEGRPAAEAFVRIFHTTPDAPMRRLLPATALPVDIYLSDADGHERVQGAVEEWLKAAGLEVRSRDDAVIGSWSIRLWFRARRPMAADLAATAAHAAELKAYLAADAAVTQMLLTAIPPVLTALHDTKDAVICAGAILIVKVDWTVYACQLTAAQQFKLQHQPELLRMPAQILALLGVDEQQARYAASGEHPRVLED